ncbi:MAG: short-chain dehydrogenase/reductase [Actinomycetia bacterium]|nr:short-chain dehydrogenase/reductase [Actinomycetes bacterium]
MKIQGMSAIVVGGASGIGRATAVRLSQFGAKVAILDLPTSEGSAAVRELGGGSSFHACDLTDAEVAEKALEAAVTALGGLRIAVNMVGIGTSQPTLATDGPHPLDASGFGLDLVGTFHLNRLQAWRMCLNEPVHGERGVIVNTVPTAAFEGQISPIAHKVMKAGIAGMTLTMARGVRSQGVRVMAIAPSPLAAGITEEMTTVRTRGAASPQRTARPEEYAELAVAIVENQILDDGAARLDDGRRFASN